MAPAPRAAPEEILTMRPPFARPHRRQHRLGAEEADFRLTRMVRSKSAFGELVEPAADDRNPGIVDENVDRTQIAPDLFHHCCDGGGLRDIGGDSDRATRRSFDPCDDGVRIICALAIIDRDGGPSSASVIATAAPMPREPPVTNATRVLKSCFVIDSDSITRAFSPSPL
jgi:hypothetical protein